MRGEHGREPGDEGRLLAWSWNAPAQPLDAEAVVPVWSQSFDVDPADAFGRWAWQDAPATPYTSTDVDRMHQVIQAMHTALSTRDKASVARLLRLKNDELGRALDLSAKQVEDGLAEYLDTLFSDPAWHMDPLDPQLQLRPMADGRIVVVNAPDGGPPLRGATAEQRFVQNLALSRVDGEWQVIR